MTINAKLTQPLTGAAEVYASLGDTSSNCNFVNDHWAKAYRFLPLTTCNQEFITFYSNKFKATNAYNIKTFVTNNRGETRPFKLRFYGCQNAAQYRLVFGIEFYKATVA
jgi:hypothetical protein